MSNSKDKNGKQYTEKEMELRACKGQEGFLAYLKTRPFCRKAGLVECPVEAERLAAEAKKAEAKKAEEQEKKELKSQVLGG